MLKRLTLGQKILLGTGLLLLVWLLSPWPLDGGEPLVCSDDAQSRLGQFVECVTTAKNQILSVRSAFCDGPDADGNYFDCDGEIAEDEVPTAALRGLNTTLGALPIGWASPALFPQSQTLTIPPRETVTLTWQATPDSREVLTGRVALTEGGPVRLSTVSPAGRPQDGPPIVCTATLARVAAAQGAPDHTTTLLAVARAIRTELSLQCASSAPCTLLLGTVSGDLSGNGECKREE